MAHEEEEEVKSLLLRHQERIILDLAGTDLLAVLVKNSVLTQSEEDLLFKTYATTTTTPSAPSSNGLTKRKLSAVASNGSADSNSSTTNDYICSSLAGSSVNNSRSASVVGDELHNALHHANDNRSITPSVVNNTTNLNDNNPDTMNDVDQLRIQCENLIQIISKSGFEKFKQFCYAIENECPQLIEDLINDRLKNDAEMAENNEEKIRKEQETIEFIDKDKENDRNRRAVSYSDGDTFISPTNITTLPRAAPRRVALMKEPPPPPPPKPNLSKQSSITSSISKASTASPILSKYPHSEYNLIQKLGSTSTLTAPTQYQPQNFYANTATIGSATTAAAAAGNNYSSLLCHSNSTSSPLAVRKREKLLHRFSDAATLGRKLKKKKNTNRTCRSMTEAIEMLADPVIEDEFFGDRTTWEYHTVAVTRVPGYGFGIAVSGGRDNPHFANGDPSIAVSDVLKGGPAEDRLQVNDRIISVNGVSLENVEYATAVQVLRDSGNTVTLVVKRRVPLNTNTQMQHQHSHSLSSVGLGPGVNGGVGGVALNGMSVQNGGQMLNSMNGPMNMSQPNSLNSSMIQNPTSMGSGLISGLGANINGQPIKVTLTKGNKKDDYGVVLGCRLFIKEISTKARDQLAANGYSLQEGDIITRIHNTNCGDTMSLKEAKKIIDGCKERLNLVVLRDITNSQSLSNNQLNNSNASNNIYGTHAPPVPNNCSNNLDDPYHPGGNAYSSQNLYVQPPTRSSGGMPNGSTDEKSNLTPRGRSRGPIMDGIALQQLDRPASPQNGRGRGIDEPPRPPPPRGSSSGNNGPEDFYSSRRQLYEERQSSEPRFISFQKEGSVGIRLTGGNEAGIFVTAVQPGSPASLQGLTPGDKILKVNDMDMHGVTREEAVLFLLSLQDRIDLIVQYCKEEYDEVVANQRGDSFHIKTHFHCENPSKGEMAFKAGDVFRVIDTLHNGVVGSWQVLKIGRGHQEMQRGVIPNKARAEELATAQFNATKKEMNANESRSNFFRRRRSTHRRSKSLSRENWDDVVFSDSISKFPAYERVVLRHPGFVRPVVIFGPISDLARDKLAKDYPDKYSLPMQVDDDDKTNTKCRIIRLSNIRDLMDRGKHALLDITPNAVDRLNYAQFYPIVVFLKTDSKHVIKHLRQGLPKTAHKSSKKLLEQCQKLDRVWSHIFSTQIVLSDEDGWYQKVRNAIDLQQSGAVWMSEAKPVESLSDDFLFPMTSNRLSYASSPESDLEMSPGPSTSLSLGNLPQLVKSSSDPSIATNQDNLDRDRDIIGDGLPPPYTNSYEHSMNPPPSRRQTMDSNKYSIYGQNTNPNTSALHPSNSETNPVAMNSRPQSLYGINAPDLPPRIDRQSKPNGVIGLENQPPTRTNSSGGTLGRSAQERLFGKPLLNDDVQAEYISRNALQNGDQSLERQARLNAAINSPAKSKSMNISATANVVNTNSTTSATGANVQQNGSYDSVSSYDSYNTSQLTMQNLGRLGPNAPDDLKSVPNTNGRSLPPVGMNSHEHRSFSGANDLNRQSSPGRPSYHDLNSNRNIDARNGPPQRPSNLGLDNSPRKQILETKTDYGKYSRNNSASQADYNKISKNSMPMMTPAGPLNGSSNANGNGTPSSNGSSGSAFKPVPPPKPKNYRPPVQGSSGSSGLGAWENGESGSPRSPNDFYYPATPSQHHHYGTQATPGSNMQATYGTNGNNYGPSGQPYAPVNGYNGSSHHYNGGSGTGPYIAPHRGMPPPIGTLPPHTPERHALDLAGSREQRGSAFELYRKPQVGTAGHHHNMSEMEPYPNHRPYEDYYAMQAPYEGPQSQQQQNYQRSRSVPRYHRNDYAGQQGPLPPAPPLSPLPPGLHPQDPNFNYNYAPPPLPMRPPPMQQAQQQQQQQQYYDENAMNSMTPGGAPPLPPHKVKKSKSVLKNPFSALKNAIVKSTRPLRRMNSMVEPEKKAKGIRRQHSMLERGIQRPYYPDEYPGYPNGYDGRHYSGRSGSVPSRGMMSREQYYREQEAYEQRYRDDMMNSTYQNLEVEDIYGNMRTVPRMQPHPSSPLYGNAYQNGYNHEHDDLYANRALIDLERRKAEAEAAHAARTSGQNGRKIVRRHSTTTADRSQGNGLRRPLMSLSGDGQNGYDYDNGYNSQQQASSAYHMMDMQRRAPNSEVMTRRRFYPGAAMENGDEPLYPSRREFQREMQRSHLYQTKKEMQERIIQGKKEIEREFSSHSSSQSERDDRSERESIYQTRREMSNKDGALKTRAQLREQIYQTRRDALDSMAEPIYVSKRDAGRPEPIYESKEESFHQAKDNETDERKERKETQQIVDVHHAQNAQNDDEESLSRSDLQKSSDTIIENITVKENPGHDFSVSKPEANASSETQTQEKKPCKAAQPEDDEEEEEDALAALEDESCAYSSGDQATAIENRLNHGMLQETANATQDLSDEVFDKPQAMSSPLVVEGPPIEPLEPPKPTLISQSSTPRSTRPPFHISNILKRTAPPPTLPEESDDSSTNIQTVPMPKPLSLPLPLSVGSASHKAGESHSSLSTQYTSLSSLPVGPPNATSTPYTSNMSLPIAGPVVPSASPNVVGPFPAVPREPTTTRGVFDSTGGTLVDKVWNVSLQIPAGAIPSGVRQEIYFTVSDPRLGQAVGGPPLDMENGETMLSPLVMCGPQGLEFLVPVTLNIPHCAGRTTSLGLALKATDSEKNLHTEWDNIDLPSNVAAHTVSVKVDHF